MSNRAHTLEGPIYWSSFHTTDKRLLLITNFIIHTGIYFFPDFNAVRAVLQTAVASESVTFFHIS